MKKNEKKMKKEYISFMILMIVEIGLIMSLPNFESSFYKAPIILIAMCIGGMLLLIGISIIKFIGISIIKSKFKNKKIKLNG